MGGEITVGAVGAALIAGIVSLLGLIISKEQKTSEFRQAWVDALRLEITNYLTGFNAIADASQVSYKDQGEKVTALSPLYSKFNEAGFAITLRINPDEDSSKEVLSCMKDFNNLASNEANLIPANIRPIEIQFLSAAKKLLKHEWKRVKRGEPTFVVTKILAAAVTIVALYLLLFTPSFLKKNGQGDARAGTTTVINDAHDTFTGPSACPPQPKSRTRRPEKDRLMGGPSSDKSVTPIPRTPAPVHCRH